MMTGQMKRKGNKTMETINSYPIRRAYPIPGGAGTRDGRVILVDTGRDIGRYVTAWLGDGDSQWCQGHYIHDFAEALADYYARVVRGY